MMCLPWTLPVRVIYLQHVVVQQAEILLHIQKIPGSNLILEAGYREIRLY